MTNRYSLYGPLLAVLLLTAPGCGEEPPFGPSPLPAADAGSGPGDQARGASRRGPCSGGDGMNAFNSDCTGIGDVGTASSPAGPEQDSAETPGSNDRSAAHIRNICDPLSFAIPGANDGQCPDEVQQATGAGRVGAEIAEVRNRGFNRRRAYNGPGPAAAPSLQPNAAPGRRESDAERRGLTDRRDGGTRNVKVGDNECIIESVAEATHTLTPGGGTTGTVVVNTANSRGPNSNPDQTVEQCAETEIVDGATVPGAALVAARNYTKNELRFNQEQQWVETSNDASWLTQTSETYTARAPGRLGHVDYQFTASENTGAERRAVLKWRNIDLPPGHAGVTSGIRPVTVIQNSDGPTPCTIEGITGVDPIPVYGHTDTTSRQTLGVTFRGGCESADLTPRLVVGARSGRGWRWLNETAPWATTSAPNIDRAWQADPPVTGYATVKVGFTEANPNPTRRAFRAMWRRPNGRWVGQYIEQHGVPPADDKTQIACLDPRSATTVLVDCPSEVAPGEQVKLQMRFEDPLTGTIGNTQHKLYKLRERYVRNNAPYGNGGWHTVITAGGGTLEGNSELMFWTAPMTPNPNFVLKLAGRMPSGGTIPPAETDRGSLALNIRNNTQPQLRIACVPVTQAAIKGCSTNVEPGEEYATFVDFYAMITDAEGVVTGRNDGSNTHRVEWEVSGGYVLYGDETYEGVSRPKIAWSPPENSDGETFRITATVYEHNHVVKAIRNVRVVEVQPGQPVVELPVLSLQESTTITEGETAGLTVSLSAAAAANIAFNYATQDGSAKAGRDYYSGGAVPRTATIEAGETSTTIHVQTEDDREDEDAETFKVRLSRPRGATIDDESRVATVTINDNDDENTLPGLSIADVTVTEAGTASLTVTLSAAITTGSVWFDYATSDGTAVAGQDYTATTGRVRIAEGDTTATVSVPTMGDSFSEASETFKVTISRPHAAKITDGEATVTITDDDAASLTLGIGTSATVTEGGSASLTVTLSAVSTTAVTFRYTTRNGTAVSGQDYTAASGTGTIAIGNTTTTVSVATIDDTIDDDAETFTVRISNPTGATISTSTSTVTITDNDDPLPTLIVDDTTINEGSTAYVGVQLNAASTSVVTYRYETSDGSATAGEDYTSRSGQASIARGDTWEVNAIRTTQDSVDEPDETFTVTVYDVVGARLVDGSATVTITDDDESPAPAAKSSFSISDTRVDEGGVATFVITRGPPYDGTVNLSWSTVPGTAGTDDFTAQSSQSVEFENAASDGGPRQVSVSVQTTDDNIFEGNETFSVDITVAPLSTSVATITDGTGVATIVDNDRQLQRNCDYADMSQTTFNAGDRYCGQLHSKPTGNAAFTNYTSPQRYSDPNTGYKPTVAEGYLLVTGENRICAYKGRCARSYTQTDGIETNGDRDYWEWVAIQAAEQ